RLRLQLPNEISAFAWGTGCPPVRCAPHQRPVSVLFEGRIEIKGFLPVRLGLDGVTLFQIDPAPRQVRSRVTRIEANRLAKVGEGALILGRPRIHHAPIVIGADIGWIELNSLAQVRDGPVLLSQMQMREAAAVVSVGRLWVELEGLVEV